MRKYQRAENNNKSCNNWILIWCSQRELVIAVIALATVLCYALWPLLVAPNTFYPVTVDGMGHLTKIKYIADCFKDLHWPSWFPYWYNGSTVMQYYPPLAYLVLVPIQMAFDNVFITFKLFAFITQFIGALGVWIICRRYVGPLVGIWGGILYALQPFLIRLILIHGVIAQGPIIALTPWFLYYSLLFMEKRTAGRWLVISLISSLLILSHAMHAFLVVLGVGFVFATMLIQGRTKIIDVLKWIVAVALGAGLVSFWWLPGVTRLETHGIPYLLPEAAANWTASWEWFNPAHSTLGLYFSGSLLLFSSLAIMFIRYPKSIGEYKYNQNLVPFYCGFILSVILSFGNHMPFFKFIPFSNNLVPGRILTFSAVLGAILCTIILHSIMKNWNSGLSLVLSIILVLISNLVLLADINPRFVPTLISQNLDMQDVFSMLPLQENSHDNGRIYWKYEVGSASNYFSMISHVSMISGWNPEGSPHYHSLIQHNIAIPLGNNDYVARDLLNWNTRYALVANNYEDLQKNLEKYGFKPVYKDAVKTVMYNDAPPSYFSVQQRDALVIGKAAKTLEMNYPWLVGGYSTFLEDYPVQYLNRFKLVYLIEPEFRNYEHFQSIIEKLAVADKVVIVSMGRDKTFPLFDIVPYWEKLETQYQLKTISEGPLQGEATLEADPGGQAPALGNTDMLWAALDGKGRTIPAIGYRKVKGHRVYFIGLSLGQQINSSHGAEIRRILEQLMDLAKPNKNIVPKSFPVIKDEWEHDGFSFSYQSQQAEHIQISVTYTPRWQARIDGKRLLVQNMENLIYIELPAGKHKVSFHYGMTWVGWLGIGLSLLSLLLVAAIYHYFDFWETVFVAIRNKVEQFIMAIGK